MKPEELKSKVLPPTPPPLPPQPNSGGEKLMAAEEVSRSKAPPPPPPPDLPPIKEAKVLAPHNANRPPPPPARDDRNGSSPSSLSFKSAEDDDSISQKSDESTEERRFIKNARNHQQRTLPFIPPQFSFPPDTNENIRPSEYLKQTKGSKSPNSPNATPLHRAMSLGELAIPKAERNYSISNRTESHETLLENDHRPIHMNGYSDRNEDLDLDGSEYGDKPPQPPNIGNNNANNTPVFNITVEQLQTVHLKKTEKQIPERTVLLQKNDLIAELKQTKDIQGVRKMKEERSRIEEVISADLAQTFKAEKFVDQVPAVDSNGCIIPPWKRQMLAKKAAEKAKKEAEEQRMRDAEAKKMNAIPAWKRQLLQRKEEQVKGPTPLIIQRTVSAPLSKNLDFPISPTEITLCENEQSPCDPVKSPSIMNGTEEPEDIPPNPWLQQLRKTKSVFR